MEGYLSLEAFKITQLDNNFSINISGTLMDLSRPKVMGILNATPDSFFAGSRVPAVNDVLRQAEGMISAGVNMLDIGGYSSRPGADDIPENIERRRVEGHVRALHKAFPEIPLSIDTFRSSIAEVALASGAHMINDISGGQLDEHMFSVVQAHGVPYIAMHMQGSPQTMKEKTIYPGELIKTMMTYFSAIDRRCRDMGIHDLVIDPGFGFAKNMTQNYYILNNLEQLQWLERPILVGLSRKSMIWKTLEITPDQALNGSTVLHTVALLKGASILRVHDVKEAVEVVQLINTLNDNCL